MQDTSEPSARATLPPQQGEYAKHVLVWLAADDDRLSALPSRGCHDDGEPPIATTRPVGRFGRHRRGQDPNGLLRGQHVPVLDLHRSAFPQLR
jgi:hypothetical protein